MHHVFGNVMKEEVNHVWLCDDLRTGAEDERSAKI